MQLNKATQHRKCEYLLSVVKSSRLCLLIQHASFHNYDAVLEVNMYKKWA